MIGIKSILRPGKFWLLFIVIIPLCVHSQDNIKNINESSSQIDQFFTSLKYTSTHSFNPKNHALWKTVTVTGFTAICFLGADFEFKEEYVWEKHYPPLNIPKYMSKAGELYDNPGPFYFTLATIGTIYGSGLIFDDSKLMQTSKLMVHSLIITGLYSTALKIIIGRARPYMGRNPHTFKFLNFKFDSGYMSLPSGHTASIFAMMSVLAGQYDSYLIKIPAYSFAMAVAVQRMENNKHWASDVLWGGVLGYLVGSSLVEREELQETSFSIQPSIGVKGLGFTLTF